ncbi:MAG: hypothetical protein AAF556_11620 [Pseudomonadota bacterium]
MAKAAIQKAASTKAKTTNGDDPADRTDANIGVLVAPKIILRRTGKRPMRFSGDKIAEVTGYKHRCDHWYEIGVYQRHVGGYAVALKHFFKSEGDQDWFYADRFDTIEELIEFLEDRDTAVDVSVDFDPDCPETSAAELALRAARLRRHQAVYKHAYECVVGELLYALEA